MFKDKPFGGIQMARSKDGIKFQMDKKNPFLEGADCDIYYEPETKIYHLITGDPVEPGNNQIIRYTSQNLIDWEKSDDIFFKADKKFNIHICPHIFKWNDWFYILAGFYPNGGVWRSRELFGPWTLQKPVMLDQLVVPKTAPFRGNRMILAGFFPDRGWGGNLVLRELVQKEDGSLGTKYPKEMVPKDGEIVKIANSSIKLSDDNTRQYIKDIPKDFHFTSKITFANSQSFKIILSGVDGLENGCHIYFYPESKKIVSAIYENGNEVANSAVTIMDVSSLKDSIDLDLYCKDDFVDFCIDSNRTFIRRYWNPGGKNIVLYSEKNVVTFDQVKISALIN